MIIKVGISQEKGITSMQIGDNRYLRSLSKEEEQNNSFTSDSWTITAHPDTKVLNVQRPKSGKCPAVAKTFTLQDGTLYLKAKQKSAEAEFSPEDLSMLIHEKYGVQEIRYADPNRIYPFRFGEDPRATTAEEKEAGLQLVWSHTDGTVSVVEHHCKRQTKEVVRFGRLDYFAGNMSGLYVDQTVHSVHETSMRQVTMARAIGEYNDGFTNNLAVDGASFAIVCAINPAYQLLNTAYVLYTEEKDHRKIIKMLDQKLASDKSLGERGFSLHGLAYDYWHR